MTSTTLHPTAGVPTVARWAGGLLLVGHGLVHALGVLLLWGLGEPGDLTVADAVPAAESAGGVVAGALWGVAGLAFVLAGILLAMGRAGWLRLAVGGAVVSLPVVALMAAAAPVGLAVDLAVLGSAVWARSRRGGVA
jgi:hypothetical protein